MSLSLSALIPAAGLSSRMGRPKPLLPFGETTAIQLLIGALRGAGVGEIVVVLGPGGEAVAEVLEGSALTLTWNLAPHSDMAASLRLGMKQLAPAATGVLVALADHPLVAPTTLATLAAGHRETPGSILIPSCQGRSGHPILLPRLALDELDLQPTLRAVVRRDPGRVRQLPVADPGILYDLDTPEDYRRALAYHASLAPAWLPLTGAAKSTRS